MVNKKIKGGNNKSNKSVEQIQDYILNLNSYKAEIEVTINSNKNNTKYIIKQEYWSKDNAKQTVIKPENISGIEIINKEGTININNSKLSLSKIYNDYPYLSESKLWLDSFIDEYRSHKDKSKTYEDGNNVVIEIKTEEKSNLTKKLYLEKGTGKPIKMIITDKNKKDRVYILYKEIDIL